MTEMYDLMIGALNSLYKQAGHKAGVLVDTRTINARVLRALEIRGYLQESPNGTVITPEGAAWLDRERRR